MAVIFTLYFDVITIIIPLKAKLQPNIGFTLRGYVAVFARSTITPPKVNHFGWNLEHSEHIVGGLGQPWQILGAIRAVATVWQASVILFFLSGK